MARRQKIEWTPEAERLVARLWNGYVDINRIIVAVRSDAGLAVKAADIHSLQKRRGGALGMIDGEARQRGPKADRIVNRKVRVRKRLSAPAPQEAGAAVRGVPFDQLAPRQCRFAHTESLPHMFCGAPAAQDSWCADHLKIVKAKER